MSDKLFTKTRCGDSVEVVPCGICSEPTEVTGTKRCDRCWELENRIYADPEIARRILGDLL